MKDPCRTQRVALLLHALSIASGAIGQSGVHVMPLVVVDRTHEVVIKIVMPPTGGRHAWDSLRKTTLATPSSARLIALGDRGLHGRLALNHAPAELQTEAGQDSRKPRVPGSARALIPRTSNATSSSVRLIAFGTVGQSGVLVRLLVAGER